MTRKELIKYTADEQDAVTGWRHHLFWKPGQRKAIKRGYCRRLRRLWKNKLRRDNVCHKQ